MKLEVIVWIVFLILVAFSFLFPKARSFSFSAIGVAIVALVAIATIAKRGESPTVDPPTSLAAEQKPVDFEKFLVDKLDKSDPGAKTRIPVEEIRFDQIHAEAGAESGSIGTVVARLYNDSTTYALTDYGYYLVVQDCIQAVCTTVFDQHGMSAVAVPPKQARDVRIAVSDGGNGNTPPIKIFGMLKVLLTPTATRAQPVSSGSAD